MGRILIIDDEPDAARAMQMLLGAAGIRADVALSGEEGLRKMGGCGLVLLDLMMPGMPGKEVLRRMAKTGATAKVIVVSAVDLPGPARDELSAIRPGLGFVSKARVTEELVACVKAALGKKSARAPKPGNNALL